MRYYEFSIKINEDAVLRSTKREVGYAENTLSGLNQFLYKHAIQNMYAFAYSKDNSLVGIAVCFDERQVSLSTVSDSMNALLSELDSSFVMAEPFTEITRFQFRDNMNEARRKEYTVTRHKMIDFSKLDMLEYDEDRRFFFNFQEQLIPEATPAIHEIYDQSLKMELDNISAHKDSIHSDVILVHYIISAKSQMAIEDIATILTHRLYDCGRLSSKRIEIVSEISTSLYKKKHFESIVDDSHGGAVIIDTSAKLGESPSAYLQSCEYIADIIKKNKNECLFIFANRLGAPSFAYQILSRIERSLNLLPIKEGYGDRRAAEDYLRALVEASAFSAHADKVNAFMNSQKAVSFSQSDILEAMDQFETWAVNQDASGAYSFRNVGELLLGHEKYVSSPSQRLEEMIGLQNVKEQIREIIAANIVDRERRQRRGSTYEARAMHMIFAGNPGTAKTTVAKLFGQIAKENHLLKSGVFVEKSGTNLFSNGENSIASIFEEAKGGILFIDEAYAIPTSQAITSLIQEMENHRDEVVTILAGYNNSMKAFLKRNDGLKSRIPYWIDFPDYTVDELVDILKLMLKDRGFEATPEGLKAAYYDFDKAIVLENFGNGRYVRNYLEDTIKKQSTRLYAGRKAVENVSDKSLFTLEARDFNPAYEVPVDPSGKTAKEKLDSMIGLTSAKKVLHKAIASFKMRKIYNERGLTFDKPTMHMVFTGNPGTAKTTTARLIAQILKDENILSSGAFVEAGRADLIGTFVGQTAPLVKEQFKKARGGVLFIDEAYSLFDSYNGYGDEAINTIVQEMENHREDVVVIFAGYPDEMNQFLDRNPGMRSRIAFHVNFEDYSADELVSITKLMLTDKHMKATDAALEKLSSIYDAVPKDTAFGNGRFVRQILEEASMNLAERIITLPTTKLSKKKLTTIEVVDIPDYNQTAHTKPHIGFAV
ncbi:MAG: AAA family ATPase [Lachnospiraceae bacterium]|nr:AAA family ATPase [Lachnospiraceae bacterium]